MGTTLDSFLLWTVPLAAAVALGLIYFVPRWLIPAASSSKRDEIVSVISARNEIRKTAAQLLAAASFVLTFVLSIYNFNRDLTQKSEQATAKQFSEAIAKVTDKREDSWASMGAFQVLSQIARQDRQYHQAVYRTMAQYLIDASRADCSVKPDSSNDYVISARVQLVARIFADKDFPAGEWRQFGLVVACLSGVKLYEGFGLGNLYMPRVRLIRADLRNARLEGTTMDRAIGGVEQVVEWWSKYKEQLTRAEDLKRFQDKNNVYYWANFEAANLSNVHANDADFRGASFADAILVNSNWERTDFQISRFERANLKGADLSGAFFDGANLEDADFSDTQLGEVKFGTADLTNTKFVNANVADADFSQARNLTLGQLRQTCIWSTKQPRVPAALSADLERIGGILPCQSLDNSSWFARAKSALTKLLSPST
jgi:uncharacterized protein YjbI with pentapeptide repeats